MTTVSTILLLIFIVIGLLATIMCGYLCIYQLNRFIKEIDEEIKRIKRRI